MAQELAEVASVEWERITALELRAGDFKALVLPGLGGHLISLEDGKGSYLRKPRNIAEYLILPEAYGLPVLFPPNRIDNRSFSARGISYEFPANKGDMHYHGFLYNRPWQVDRIAAEGGVAALDLSFTSPAGGEVYRWFPHPFTVCLSYRLEAQGLLSQEITIKNQDSRPMPLMLGFHSAFALDDRAENPAACRISIGLGDALEGSQRSPAPAEALAFRQGKVLGHQEVVWGQFYAGTYQGADGPERGLCIEYQRTGKKLRYLPDEQFGYWVVWNQNGVDTYICAEPQTCAITAANMHQEQDLFGFRMLDAGKSFVAASSLRVE